MCLSDNAHPAAMTDDNNATWTVKCLGRPWQTRVGRSMVSGRPQLSCREETAYRTGYLENVIGVQVGVGMCILEQSTVNKIHSDDDRLEFVQQQ